MAESPVLGLTVDSQVLGSTNPSCTRTPGQSEITNMVLVNQHGKSLEQTSLGEAEQ